MAEIVKVFKESMPKVKFIGRRYLEKDRDQFGSFGSLWGEWFARGYFDKLKGAGKGIEKVSDDFIGLMRMTSETEMEYWIGIFMAPEDEVPEGFESVMLDAGELAVAYVHGTSDDGDVYGEEPFNKALEAWAKEGFKIELMAWCFERYNSPRFTEPDENGKIILDLCVYL